MFAYLKPLSSSAQQNDIQRFFRVRERPEEGTRQMTLVVLSALLLGGLSELLGLPVMGCILTLAVVVTGSLKEWEQGAHVLVDRLALFATALFYLGLGHCLGALSLLGLPWLVKRLSSGR